MKNPRRPSVDASQNGAVAIITAIVALVLFGSAALAVELTDMFSRDRAVQTTADLAAFAGAQDLPDTCGAFDQALVTLNDPGNGVRTDNGASPFAATAAQMRDGNLSNGEIQLVSASGLQITGCANAGRLIRVITPPRNVKFAFGAAIRGASAGDVRGRAAVALRGLQVSVLPLSLPSNCPAGPNYLYVNNGNVVTGSDSTGTPAYSPGGNNNGPHIGALTPNNSALPTSVTTTVTNLTDDPSLVGKGVVFDFHLLKFDGTTVRQPGPAPSGIAGTVVPGTVVKIANNDWQAQFSVGVPTTVATTPGSWKVRGLQAGGADKWTPDSAVGTLTIGVPTATGCPDPSTGDFGLLNSPRSDGGSTSLQRFRNFARGIDHALAAVLSPTTDVPCAFDGSPYADGILDDNVPARGDESCIDVKPGEAVSLPTDGLIDGRNGEPGRLQGTPGVTPGTSPGDKCTVSGDPDLRWRSKSGQNLVDTVLSCYLAPGRTLLDVAAGTPDSLTANIASDPRFFYIPVTDTTTRPKNSVGGAKFWPISAFRGAFATNENMAGDATCIGFSDCNGLLFNNGGTQLEAVQAFTFPLSALPTTVDQPGNGGDYYGGTKDFLLVE